MPLKVKEAVVFAANSEAKPSVNVCNGQHYQRITDPILLKESFTLQVFITYILQ